MAICPQCKRDWSPIEPGNGADSYLCDRCDPGHEVRPAFAAEIAEMRRKRQLPSLPEVDQDGKCGTCCGTGRICDIGSRMARPCRSCHGSGMKPDPQPSVSDADLGDHVADAMREGPVPPGVTDALGRAPKPCRQPDKTIAELSAEVSENLATFKASMAAAKASIADAVRSIRRPDTVEVPQVELDLLREAAKAVLVVTQRFRKRAPWRPDLADVVDIGKRIIDRKTDLGTLSEAERQLALDKSNCIEAAIDLAADLGKHYEAHSALVLGVSAEQRRLQGTIELVAELGHKLEDS